MENGANADNHELPLYFNRELSWLHFNQRVLDEAATKLNPVFERMKFLSIVSSNLDEFFMIRVATLHDQVHAGYDRPDESGYTASEQIAAISARVREMNESMYALLRKEILPELLKHGIRFVDTRSLSAEQEAFLDEYFISQVYPVLTPMAVDSSRPFPLILNRSLNLGVLLRDESELHPYEFATVQVPSVLPRVVRLPGDDAVNLVLLEHIIARNIRRLFFGREVLCCHAYRITRNADLTIDEEGAEDLLKEIEKSLRQRRWGAAIRLEIDHRADARLVGELERWLELEPGAAYPIHGPVNLDFLMKQVYGLPGFERLKYAPFTPNALALREGENLFDAISRRDILLYHPYDSFDPVVQFVQEAARDPRVLAIKQTLYRVSGNSPIVRALIEAAESGKQVTVLLELKARFDEENNIHWGKSLEIAGAHVIYGLVGLKTHSKIALVVRREEEGIRRYVHLATGNYNDVTARIYTDHGLFTANQRIGEDASAFFNMLTGYSEPPELRMLAAAPHKLRSRFLFLIDRETKNAQQGLKAEIFAKMNSLVDKGIIDALYAASRAGVKIKLLIRGVCCLRPGLAGVSENIRVHSIVGRFLEHSRIFVFHNAGRQEVYLSSADWMPRNLDRRVELLFPLEDPALAARALDLLRLQWRDNVKSSELTAGGEYVRAVPERADDEPLNVQEYLLEHGDAQ